MDTYSSNNSTLAFLLREIHTTSVKEVKRGVIPVDKPTVPKAEKASKTICERENGSIIEIKTIIKKTTTKDKINRSKAFSTLSRAIFLPKASGRSLFFNEANINRIITAKVVVFIPAPVLPGEAPINISKQMSKIVAIDA